MLAEAGSDPEVRLLLPEKDVAEPELSIVIPALERGADDRRLRRLVPRGPRGGRRRRRGPHRRQLRRTTPPSSRSRAARGCCGRHRRGLGRAYIDALPFVRGKYILMGDADCTYDFRQLAPFVERLREGYEFVMGSRWKGSIEPGAMPALHRYLGTPLTTWILNRLYSQRLLRHPLRDARDHPRRARADGPPVAVVGVRVGDGAQVGAHGAPDRRGAGAFLKDREGRAEPPQARRLVLAVEGGVDQPARDVRLRLGLLRVQARARAHRSSGLLLTAAAELRRPRRSGRSTLSLNWQFLGVALLAVGLQAFFLGCIAQVLFDYTGRHRRAGCACSRTRARC